MIDQIVQEMLSAFPSDDPPRFLMSNPILRKHDDVAYVQSTLGNRR